jgi:hypothetical protein
MTDPFRAQYAIDAWSTPAPAQRGRVLPDVSPGLKAMIASLGRTEDIQLSPDNRLLALAGYSTNRLFLFSIDIDVSSPSPRVRLSACLVLESSVLSTPHGVAFLDDHHLLVCDRSADVCIFRIPSVSGEIRKMRVEPLAVISGKGTLFAKVKNPGSAACYPLAADSFRVLICNNYWNFISSHVVHLGRPLRVEHQAFLSDERICVPDGVSISPDRAWFTVSNHVSGEAFLYRTAVDLGAISEPAAVLGGMVCPHGLRFVGDDTIVVADAASQYLHVFRRDGNEWSGRQTRPAQSIRLLSDPLFLDGRFAPGEGGIKGVDVDRSRRLLITTHTLDPLGFYDLSALFGDSDQCPEDARAELCRQRDDSLMRSTPERLVQRWTTRQRVGQAVREQVDRARGVSRKVRISARLLQLAARNRFASDRILDPGGPVVSLTTHSSRIDRAHYAIESIARGTVKPSRILLWLTADELLRNLPVPLRRLQSSGVEIRLVEEFGPHSKYFPYLESQDEFDRPLVTADDDALYHTDWLRELVQAHEQSPEQIHCHRVRRIVLKGDELAPYNTWPFGADSVPSHLNFIMGVNGAIYPPAFLAFLKHAGRAFMKCCPTGDDIWLTANAIRAGVRVRQVREAGLDPVLTPGTQGVALFHLNMLQGANQVQLRRTFTPSDLEILRVER